MRLLTALAVISLLTACDNPRTSSSSERNLEVARKTTEEIQSGDPRARMTPPESWRLPTDLAKGEFAKKAEALLDEAEKRIQAVSEARIEEQREGGSDLAAQQDTMGRVASMVQIARRYISELESSEGEMEMYNKGRVQALLEEIQRESIGHSGIPFDKVSNPGLPG